MMLRQMAGDDPTCSAWATPTIDLRLQRATQVPQRHRSHLARHRGARPHSQSPIYRNIIAVANTLLEEGAAGIVPAKDDGEVPMVRSYNSDEEEAARVTTWLAPSTTG